jgi:hypothetical protein
MGLDVDRFVKLVTLTVALFTNMVNPKMARPYDWLCSGSVRIHIPGSEMTTKCQDCARHLVNAGARNINP